MEYQGATDLSFCSPAKWRSKLVRPLCVVVTVVDFPDFRVSVSRAIKPLVDTEGKPPDYFSQKNCAQQYSSMLDKAGTHKRKRSTADGTTEAGV